MLEDNNVKLRQVQGHLVTGRNQNSSDLLRFCINVTEYDIPRSRAEIESTAPTYQLRVKRNEESCF